MKSKRSWPGVPYRRTRSPPGRFITPKSMATVVAALTWLTLSEALASVDRASMSDSTLTASVLPAPTGPTMTIL